MLRKPFILLLCQFLVMVSKAQMVKVLDQETLLGIEGVQISVSRSSHSIITGPNGKAALNDILPADTLILRRIGYLSVTLVYEKVVSRGYQIFLQADISQLNEVVISASRFEEKKADVPRQIEVIKQRDIEFASLQNTSDLLQCTGNVFVQKSQMGGGSPILRGFEANKVLIVVDGIRMNNAIYRGGHLQNVISIDQSVLKRAEVVFGPGSTIYGSDALGGVMHFVTRDPVTSGKKGDVYTTGSVYTRYASANTEKTIHGDLNLGFGKIASLTSFTYSDLGDLRQGRWRNSRYPDHGKKDFLVQTVNGVDEVVANPDVNLQRPGGYEQSDLLQKFRLEQNRHTVHTLNLQYSTTSDVPRYDRLAQHQEGKPDFAQWYYGPQKRALYAYHLEHNRNRRFVDKVKMVLSYQQVEESRHTRRFGRQQLMHRLERVDVMRYNVDLEKQLKAHELRYGAEAFQDRVRSAAWQEHIITGSESPLDTRYPNGATMRGVATYITHAIEHKEKWVFSDGLRFSYTNLNAPFKDQTFFPFPFMEVDQIHYAVNGNIGLVYFPGREYKIAVSGSSGFRAPNIDDLSKVFESVPGNVVVPNNELRPEYTYNLETSVHKKFLKVVQTSLAAYYTYYKDAITIMPGSYKGNDSIHYDGAMSRVMMSRNAAKAHICGFNAVVDIDLPAQLIWRNSLNYTYGRFLAPVAGYPLDHIPPLFGKSALLMRKNRFRAELWMMFNGWKRLKDYNLIGEDNFHQATPDGMPAWYTINLRASVRVGRHWEVQAAVHNILDRNYRVFASGISAPGRDLSITVRLRL